ncbi:RsmD family RNA methyltransferase [Planktotalea sp.]|uniref:class I SAM-dependent RNA methyltransferase n=1 Tax=Planktotalea sp. TaxID=2029877 RepID=UPI0025FEECBF|nr:RsmD family RNA methyltransferase [Planktotalea sp.]
MDEFLIERLGFQGDGIAKGPIFVPRTLPGERVQGIRNGDRLSDVKIIEPSETRVSAICRHYKSCGGCQLQHAADPFVADFKQQIVKNALDAHGIETEFRPIVTSPVQSRRRATFAVRRTKKGALWGFHARGSDTVIAVPDCQLVLPELLEVSPMLDDLAMIGGSRKGEMAVTVTISTVGLDVFVKDGKPLDKELTIALSGLVEKHKLARLVWDDEVIGMRNPPFQRFGAGKVTPPPGAFLQATQHGQDSLTAAVLDAVDGARGIDLFSGSGTFTLPLAERSEIWALESDKAMIRALDDGWRMAKGLKKVIATARDLYRRPALPDEFKKFDFAVLDPPRAGAEAQVAEIAQSALGQLAYVSCNPVTFARDAKVLIEAGFNLDWIQVVDQFRWSSHVELAAKFSRS